MSIDIDDKNIHAIDTFKNRTCTPLDVGFGTVQKICMMVVLGLTLNHRNSQNRDLRLI